MCACVLSLFLISCYPHLPTVAMAVDCHALVSKATSGGGKIPPDVRLHIADFVCGPPSAIPRAILDSCDNRQTIIDSWPVVRTWNLTETFGVDCSFVGGSVIRRYCMRTVLVVDLKIDPVSLDFLVGNELCGVIRVDVNGLALSGLVSQRVADDVEDGLLTRLYIQSVCGVRYPSAAEFSAIGVVGTDRIQSDFARELEESHVMDEHDYENLSML
jgi:hypothetical protein